MKEVLQKLIEYTESAQTVVVEAAHIYADKEPDKEQQASSIVASEVLSALNKPTHKTLLIDDIHITNPTLDLKLYTQWLTKQGYSIDEVMMESTLIPDANQLLGQIGGVVSPRQLVVAKKEPWELNGSMATGLWTEVGKVPLLTPGGQPTCNLLDATFYIRKAQLGETCITILPKPDGQSDYIKQQLQTLAVLRRVRPDISVVNIFFNPNNFWDDLTITFNRKVKQ